MQFSLAASTLFTVAITLAYIAPSAFAATCYDASGCQQCESEDSMESARSYLCGGTLWQGSTSFGWGWGRVTLDGSFYSQDDCNAGFENIIVQCYGHEDGGIYTYSYNGDNARLDVDFCDCE
ncbi:hypothetical protein BD414DRAFT_455641 [Trametes punicea]|nr:hypothetical protein BD414DRAFT_455641 [Trametes punicea]